ncbi:hypothetical protein HMN09_01415100 [Mycena chlorophos]|uniref:Uncharacterized protein n=1 Tax=Mycena chlorophos TaxID=658473 RepID=A0A8H6VU25_MYCCL|nr:hypothetical protein HMN09_01415100 [Mycena chlorophos]
MDNARAAALRARGLLPALPLSVQEAQQDSRIAVVASPEPGMEPGGSGLVRRPTEASRIKEQWEAKNKDAKEEQAAREAGVKTRLTEFRFGGNSPVSESFVGAGGLGAVAEVDTPPEDDEGYDSFSSKVPKAPPPTLSLSRGRNLSPPLLQPWSDNLPLDPTPLRTIPGSPADSNSLQLPSLISAFATDAGLTPVTPGFALEDDATPRELSPPRGGGLGFDGSASESGESLAVPSLALDSGSESATTLASTAESSNVGRMRSVKAKRNSVLEEREHHAIQVIVETPFERSTSPETDVTAKQLSPAATPTTSLRAPQRRGTAPVAGGVRKSILGSIRRTVGLGRANSSATKGRLGVAPPSALATSHASMSPTQPSALASQQQQQRKHERRTSINPTMHNTGSIMSETNRIEDDETRRMTELAFM